MEWFVLVPLFPFWQPLFTLQQPYWIGLLVLGSSAVMYPLFARLRWAYGDTLTRDVRFTNGWITGAVASIALLGTIEFFGRHGYEVPWMGSEGDADQTYIRQAARSDNDADTTNRRRAYRRDSSAAR